MNFVLVAQKKELLAEINFYLRKIPSSKLKFEVKGAQVTLQNLRVKNVKMNSSMIDATLAVALNVDKQTLLTTVSAEGEVEIEGQLHFSISPAWQSNSSFQYLSHQWLENPDVNIGMIQFSVKSLIDNIIDKQKENIEQTINKQLMTFSDLSVYMNKILPFVNQAIKFQTTQLHILPNIEEIIIENITDNKEEIAMSCTLITDSKFILSSDGKDQAKLPILTIQIES